MAKILLEYDADIQDLAAKLNKVYGLNIKVDESAKKTGKTLTKEYLDAAKAAGTVQRETTKLNSTCLLYTSPSPRDGLLSRMPSSA